VDVKNWRYNMINELRDLEKLGYVKSTKHREQPLVIWNYTPVVQYEKLFGDYPLLRKCRGLVTDDQGTIVARGFEKFFNFEEHHVSELPSITDKVEITEKMDGSLIIVFRYQNQVVYATRGTFYSDQALAASKLFKEIYQESWIQDGFTYLFEYVSPENRIVVAYPEANLIHLAKLDSSTGYDLDRDNRFRVVDTVNVETHTFADIVDAYARLKSFNSKNKEGFVIRVISDGSYPDWRCKIKFEDYIKLHRIMTGVSNKTVWEMLRDGSSIESMLEVCPDEFNDFLRNTKAALELRYLGIESRAKYAYDCAKELASRREQAMFLMSNYKELSSIVFRMLDGQDYSKAIWNMIKPDRYIQPFANKDED